MIFMDNIFVWFCKIRIWKKVNYKNTNKTQNETKKNTYDDAKVTFDHVKPENR